MTAITIPSVEIELDDKLSLVIRSLEYTPEEPGKTTGLPEDCYPGNGPSLNWRDDDVFLVHTSYRHKAIMSDGMLIQKRVKSVKEFPAPKGLADLYYDSFLEAVEEM